MIIDINYDDLMVAWDAACEGASWGYCCVDWVFGTFSASVHHIGRSQSGYRRISDVWGRWPGKSGYYVVSFTWRDSQSHSGNYHVYE